MTFCNTYNFHNDSVEGRKCEIQAHLRLNSLEYFSCHLLDILPSRFRDTIHRLLSKNTQEVVSRNVKPEMHLSIYLSSLLKHYFFFFKLSMRENKREATVFALDKVLPSSHPPCLPPIAPISCLYLFHQILRVHLCVTFSFWSLSSPCHSLQSVRQKCL